MSVRFIIGSVFAAQALGLLVSLGANRPSVVGRRYFVYHGGAALLLLAFAWFVGLSFFQSPFAWVNFAASGLLLGFVMNAMLLGHWYLIQPKMPIEELKRVCLGFVVFMLVRSALGVLGLFLVMDGKSESEIYRYLLAQVPGLFILMRISWGLVFPLVLSWFIWKTVQIRSTQSATGLLYVAVLAVVTGEILSHYLALAHGVYI